MKPSPVLLTTLITLNYCQDCIYKSPIVKVRTGAKIKIDPCSMCYSEQYWAGTRFIPLRWTPCSRYSQQTFCSFKAAIIKIFLITVAQMTVWCERRSLILAYQNKLSPDSAVYVNSMECFSIRQLNVLVSQPTAFLFWLSLMFSVKSCALPAQLQTTDS